MDEVAVLGVLEAEERSVGGERAAQDAALVHAAEAHRLGRAVDLDRRAAVERHVHGEPLAVADPGDDDARPPARVLRSSRAARPRGTAGSRRLRTAAPATVRTRRPSRPGTRGRPRRRASARRRPARPGVRSPAGACPARGPTRAPARSPTRSRSTRSGRARSETTPGGRSRARGSAAPRPECRCRRSPGRRLTSMASSGVLIAGNWKMFKGPHVARSFATQIRHLGSGRDRLEVVVCPPCVSLAATLQGLGEGSEVRVYAQNVHWELEGAFTGEVSAPMLAELSVKGTLVGHSERRQHFGETDETVRLRAEAALEAGLAVIACVGETEAEREAERTEDVLRRQVSVLPQHERLVIAYEPVWAIGTGKTATPETAQEAHAFIKSLHPTEVLYGGSVKPENASALLSQPDIDGALVGGASLDAQDFEAICLAAAEAAAREKPRRARDPGRVGTRPARARERGRARGDAGLRRALGALPAHDAPRLGRGGRAPAGPDGELGGGTPDDRVGPRALPGPDAREPGDPRWLLLRERGARRRLPPRERAGRRRPPPRTRLLRRRPLAHRAPARAPRARRARGYG